MGPELFRGLTLQGYDIAVAWDYRDLTFGAELSGYEEIVVLAWSFGAPAAEHFLREHPTLPVTARIAVAATLYPADDALGIPESIFRATLEGLNERSLRKFRMRMCGGAAAFTAVESRMPARPVSELREELEAIGKREIVTSDAWDVAFIPEDDLIIPPATQRACWGRHSHSIRAIPGAHLPDFCTILSRVLNDKDNVRTRFARSRATYGTEAVIQSRITRRLLSMLPPTGSNTRILEIGAGLGDATRALSAQPHATLSAWDLHISPSVAAITDITTRECDAETAIMSLPDESVDLLVSASTMQWFNSPFAFLRHVRRVLAPGGEAVISTFGPDTMHELHEALGTVSAFPAPEAYSSFGVVESEIHSLSFPSASALLRHIRATGVNGNGGSLGGPSAARRLLRAGVTTLTYQPIYIRITK